MLIYKIDVIKVIEYIFIHIRNTIMFSEPFDNKIVVEAEKAIKVNKIISFYTSKILNHLERVEKK